MRKRVSVFLVLVLILVLFPSLVSGNPQDITAVSGSPLKFVDTVFKTWLGGATAVAASPDDQFIYTVSSNDNALTVFRRDLDTGILTFIQVLRENVGGVGGIYFPLGIAVSPDGRHVYTASAAGGVGVFSRDALSGKLTFVINYIGSDPGFVGLTSATAVVLSPEGDRLYIAYRSGDSILVMEREEESGFLTHIEQIQDGDDGVTDLDGPVSLTISPDGKHLYTANAVSDSVAVFSRNLPIGSLDFVESNENGIGGLEGLDGANDVAVSPDGKNVYAVSTEDDALVVFSRNQTNGGLTWVETLQDGVDGVNGLNEAWSVIVSHDNKNVYAAAERDHTVSIFDRNPDNGRLIYLGKPDALFSELAQTRDVYSTADGKHTYSVGHSPGGVVAFHRDQTSGILEPFDAIGSGDGLDGAVGIGVDESPHGCVYVAGNNDDSVALFSRDGRTGELIYEDRRKNGSGGVEGLDGARSVVVSPDGGYIYVAGHDEDAITVFSYYDSSNPCSWIEYVEVIRDGVAGVTGLDAPQALAMSPDGTLLYAASEQGDSLVVFDVNPTDGTLSHRQTLQDGVGGVDGLNGAYSVATSNDGKHVYVTGFYDNSVVVFRWDSGSLEFVEQLTDGVDGVDGLYRANSIVISPDDAHLYVASRLDNAIALFSRDSASGVLTYLGMVKDGVDGVDGLNGARAVAITPDGKMVFVASQYENALSVFKRDASTGLLTYLGMHRDGDGIVEGLGAANGIAVSPDGGYVYVTGYDDDAVVIFARWRLFLPMGLK